MRIPLASLPLHAVDLDGRITLRRGSDDEPGARVVVLGCDADAVRAAAPHLGAVLWLSLCDGPPATTPGPSRDELAARLAECERELATATGRNDSLRSAVTAMAASRDALDTALRVLAVGGSVDFAALEQTAGVLSADDVRSVLDREPPQRAAGVVAGVADDVVDGWCGRLNHALRGAPADLAGEVVSVVSAMRAAARQYDGGAVGRGERVEGAQQGAADVGGVAERVVIAEGVANLFAGDGAIGGDNVRGEVAAMLDHAVRQYEGRDVAIVVEVRGEGGAAHSSTISPSVAARESRGGESS